MTGDELRGRIAGLRGRTTNAELLAVLDEAVRLEGEVRRLEEEVGEVLNAQGMAELEVQRLKALVARLSGELKRVRRWPPQTIAAVERARRHEERKRGRAGGEEAQAGTGGDSA